MNLFRVLRQKTGCWGWIFIVAIWAVSDLAQAQYVRTETYPTEQDRRTRYALGDWVSYMTTQHFSTMTVGTHYIYVGTTDGGILRYHIYDNFWDYPFTVSNGLPSNHIVDLVYDPQTSFLWAVTPNDVAIFQPASEEWIRKSETPNWPYEFPTVEENGANPINPGENFVPKERFFGREALLELPTFFANGAYSILGDWVLLDEFTFDEFPIVGYLRDRYDRIWFLVEGFGIGQGDFFSKRADFYPLGLPDFSPRAIEYQYDDLWFGGISTNRTGRTGIGLWPYDGPGWTYFQAPRISRLPKDDVNAILADGDSVWFGSVYGVSLYDRGKDRWKNYNTGDGLSHNQVNDLAILGDELYAATDQGISRINRLTGLVERVKDSRFLNLPFYRLAIQGDTLWAATFRGIYRYAARFPKWQLVPARAAIQDLEVTAVSTFQNEVWFAAPSGVMWLDLKTDTWQSYPQVATDVAPPYRDIKADGAAIWVATRDGLLKFDRRRQNWRLFTTEDGLLANRCYSLMLDGDFIWVVNRAGVTQFYWNNPQRID